MDESEQVSYQFSEAEVNKSKKEKEKAQENPLSIQMAE